MFAKIITIMTVIAAGLLIFVMTNYNPTQVGPAGILTVFFLLYVMFVGVFTALIRWSSWIIRLLQRWMKFTRAKPPQELSTQKAYYLASVVALAPVMLIGIGSVGSLHWYEVVLVGIFVAIGYFYIERRS